MILGSGRRLSLNSATHPETLQINSAIGSFFGVSLDTDAACDSGILPAIPCLMILICVLLPVPIWSTSIILSDYGISLLPTATYCVSCLNIPEVLKHWVRTSEKGNRQIALVARNNGAY